MTAPAKMYRFQERHTASLLGNSGYGSSCQVECVEFNVIRETPRGAWIRRDYGDFAMVGDTPRFVLLSGRKRHAWPTKEEAMESFRARKRAQIRILTAQIARAKTALAVGMEMAP